MFSYDIQIILVKTNKDSKLTVKLSLLTHKRQLHSVGVVLVYMLMMDDNKPFELETVETAPKELVCKIY